MSTRTKALSDRALFLSHFKLSELPTFPISNRPLEELRSDPDIWFYSLSERRTFRRHLEEKTRFTLQAMNELRYNQLVTEYAAKRAQFEELQRKVCFRVSEADSRYKPLRCRVSRSSDVLPTARPG